MIRVYGASDDLVEVQGCEGADEFGHYCDGDPEPFVRPPMLPDDTRDRILADLNGRHVPASAFTDAVGHVLALVAACYEPGCIGCEFDDHEPGQHTDDCPVPDAEAWLQLLLDHKGGYAAGEER